MARDPDLDLLKALRLLAFDAVTTRPSDYITRFLHRWFSREFHVDIREVESVPIEEILEHYLEVRYEEMSDLERDEEAGQLRETRDERLAREAQEGDGRASDEAFFADAKAQAATQHAKFGAFKLPGQAAEPGDAPDPPLAIMGEALPQRFTDLEPRAPVKAGQQVVRKDDQLPPDIKMSFVSQEEMDRLEGESWDLLGPPGKK